MNLGFSLFFVLLAVWYLLPHLVRKIHCYNIQKFCRKNKLFILTFDDGPCAKLTPRILEILDRYRVHGTFYLLGHKAEQNIEWVQNVASKGHDIASHSYQHLNAWKVLPWKAIRDIGSGFRALDNCSVPHKLFRAPYGKVSIATWIYVKYRNKNFGWWTYDSTDTHKIPASREQIVSELLLLRGGVILLHDISRKNDVARDSFVVELTKDILEMVSNNGFFVVTQTELLKRYYQESIKND